MIQKPTQSRLTLTWVISALMLAFCATSFASTFTVKITPKSSGHVLWSTTDPSNNGTISGSGGSFTYTINSSTVILTFVPNPGGSIVKVYSVGDGDDTSWVLSHGNQDSWYGPGENSKLVTVTFSGGTATTTTDPTGAFGFSFPTNNASLTAITDLSGTYTGTTVSVKHPRHYNVSVAQDDSGKLSGVGTVEGIAPQGAVKVNGVLGATATIDTGIIGAITTVNNQPTAQLKGKFDGTIDGAAATASGSGQGPVAVTTNCVNGTASIKANIGGVPYSQNNMPLTLPVSSTAASHIHKSWSIALTITNTASAGAKSSIMASAILTLPNGDHIAYPLKKTKYSSTKGYSLSFKGGTNVTVVPNAVDKKSAVSIKGMTLTKPATTWTPTAGTISYQFLGQKGTADLMTFISH